MELTIRLDHVIWALAEVSEPKASFSFWGWGLKLLLTQLNRLDILLNWNHLQFFNSQLKPSATSAYDKSETQLVDFLCFKLVDVIKIFIITDFNYIIKIDN